MSRASCVLILGVDDDAVRNLIECLQTGSNLQSETYATSCRCYRAKYQPSGYKKIELYGVFLNELCDYRTEFIEEFMSDGKSYDICGVVLLPSPRQKMNDINDSELLLSSWNSKAVQKWRDDGSKILEITVTNNESDNQDEASQFSGSNKLKMAVGTFGKSSSEKIQYGLLNLISGFPDTGCCTCCC